jgi:uncharacterized SAM-binding protein YcdF (DUF218 family)
LRSWLRFLLLLLVVPALAYGAGLQAYIAAIPREAAEDETVTDAIVVLTGGPGRVPAGLDLLARRRAGKLLVSGVYRGVDVTELLRVVRQAPHAVECCIVLGYSAETTTGNAAETRDWMRREGFRSLRLVTADFHIPRSVIEFRRAMPEIAIVLHPVATEWLKRDRWWTRRETVLRLVGEYNKLLASLVRSYLGVLRAGFA